MTSPIQAAPADVVEKFATLLLDGERPLLELAAVLALWDAADPGWAGTSAGRVRLADALDQLELASVIELPSRLGVRWDPTLPRLPLRVVIPANRRPTMRGLDASSEPWVPALAWAGAWIRATRPPQRLRVALVAANRWLASTLGQPRPVVCREERSLQVFDDEKTLSTLGGTALFEPGRLDLQTLACEAPVGGVKVACLAARGPVLVLENKATFDSAWRGLRARSENAGYAAVIFGGGDQAASLVTDLLVLHELVGVSATAFEYAGDVDVAGVSAACAFIDVARSAGLAAGPAVALWEALGTARPAGEDLTGDDRERAAALASAKRVGLPEVVATRLREGVRTPQERLDRTILADTSWWWPS